MLLTGVCVAGGLGFSVTSGFWLGGAGVFAAAVGAKVGSADSPGADVCATGGVITTGLGVIGATLGMEGYTGTFGVGLGVTGITVGVATGTALGFIDGSVLGTVDGSVLGSIDGSVLGAVDGSVLGDGEGWLLPAPSIYSFYYRIPFFKMQAGTISGLR